MTYFSYFVVTKRILFLGLRRDFLDCILIIAFFFIIALSCFEHKNWSKDGHFEWISLCADGPLIADLKFKFHLALSLKNRSR